MTLSLMLLYLVVKNVFLRCACGILDLPQYWFDFSDAWFCLIVMYLEKCLNCCMVFSFTLASRSSNSDPVNLAACGILLRVVLFLEEFKSILMTWKLTWTRHNLQKGSLTRKKRNNMRRIYQRGRKKAKDKHRWITRLNSG